MKTLMLIVVILLSGCTKTKLVDVEPVNHAPIIDLVRMDAISTSQVKITILSHDPDRDEIQYLWDMSGAGQLYSSGATDWPEHVRYYMRLMLSGESIVTVLLFDGELWTQKRITIRNADMSGTVGNAY